jgi:hypothetical protein
MVGRGETLDLCGDDFPNPKKWHVKVVHRVLFKHHTTLPYMCLGHMQVFEHSSAWIIDVTPIYGISL